MCTRAFLGEKWSKGAAEREREAGRSDVTPLTLSSSGRVSVSISPSRFLPSRSLSLPPCLPPSPLLLPLTLSIQCGSADFCLKIQCFRFPGMEVETFRKIEEVSCVCVGGCVSVCVCLWPPALNTHIHISPIHFTSVQFNVCCSGMKQPSLLLARPDQPVLGVRWAEIHCWAPGDIMVKSRDRYCPRRAICRAAISKKKTTVKNTQNDDVKLIIKRVPM